MSHAALPFSPRNEMPVPALCYIYALYECQDAEDDPLLDSGTSWEQARVIREEEFFFFLRLLTREASYTAY